MWIEETGVVNRLVDALGLTSSVFQATDLVLSIALSRSIGGSNLCDVLFDRTSWVQDLEIWFASTLGRMDADFEARVRDFDLVSRLII